MKAGFVLKDIETGETLSYNPADYPALLRVARAAEDAWPFMFEDMPKKLNSKRAKYEKLYKALKDVQHLFDK